MEFVIGCNFRNLSIFDNNQYLNLQIYLILPIYNLYHLILLLLYLDLHLVQMQLQINYILNNYHLHMFLIYYFISINFFMGIAQFFTSNFPILNLFI